MYHDGGQYLPGRLALLPAARYYVPDLTKRPDDFADHDDPDVAFQRVVAAGATVVWSVNNQPFGWCVGRIVDPFGHHWQIGKPLARSP